MAKTSQASRLASWLNDTLGEYDAVGAVELKKAVNKVAKQVDEEIKAHAKFQNRTGNYVKAFAISTVHDSRRARVKVWHVREPHYRRSHLLENGHRTRSGTRTRAYPHIKYGEEWAKNNLEREILKGYKR